MPRFASHLGPRFLDWQLANDPAKSWTENEAHAAQLDALWKHARQLAGVDDETSEDSMSMAVEAPATYNVKPGKKGKSDPSQPELF